MDCEDDFFFPFQKMNPVEAFEIENRHYEVLIPIKSKKKKIEERTVYHIFKGRSLFERKNIH